MKKALTNKLDKAFALVVKKKGKCEWCGSTTRQLHCSHLFGRRNRSVRWDLDNAVIHCSTCHRKWHENPVEGFLWLTGYKGKDFVDRLRLKANETRKWTDKEGEEWLEELNKMLQESN